MYVRYVDDIFMIWPHTLEELDAIVTHFNRCTDSIRFTTEISKTEIHFLNSKCRLNEGKVETDLYTKPTDSHDCSTARHIHNDAKTASPTVNVLRVRQICCKIMDFDYNIVKLG